MDRRSLMTGASALLVGFAVFDPLQAQVADLAEQTPPDLMRTKEQNLLRDRWLQDNRIYLQDRSTSAERKDYRIVGDIVVLSEANFPSLARGEGSVLAGKSSIVIEAREVVFSMPLRLDDTELIVLAEQVSFTPVGFVSMTTPAAGFAQRVDICARRMTLEGGLRLPFQFRLDREFRTIRFALGELVDQNGATAGDTAQALEIIRLSSLSFHAADILPDTVVLSDADYLMQMGRSVWPEATVLKLQRFHGRDPYSPEMQAFIGAWVARLAPVFALQASGVAEAAAIRLQNCIDRQTDLHGLRKTDVPMTALNQQIAGFERALVRQFGEDGKTGLAAAWDELALRASRSGAVDSVAIALTNADIAGLDAEMALIEAEAERLGLSLDKLEDDIAALNSRIELQETFVKQTIVAKTFQNPNHGIAIGVKALAVVGSIAFPAAAPTLMVVSGIVSAIDAVNRSDGDLAEKAFSVADVIQAHVAITEESRKLRSSWSEARQGFPAAKAYVTSKSGASEAEAKAFADWKKSLGELQANGKALFEGLTRMAPAAKIVFDDDLIQNDPTMVSLVQERNLLVEQQAADLGRMAVTLGRSNELAGEILQRTAQLAALQALDLTNDQENIRLRQLADWARVDAAEKLSRQAVLLRRSVDYSTSARIDVPEDILYFAEGDLAEQATFAIGDITTHEGQLQARRQERFLAYSAILDEARQAHDTSRALSGWNIGVPITYSAHISDNSGQVGHQEGKRAFIRALNQRLADAIRTRRRSLRLDLPPFGVQQITTTENAVLVGINVSELTFTAGRAPDSEFLLVIEHPNYGALLRDGVLTYYSNAPPSPQMDGLQMVKRRSIPLPGDVFPEWRSAIPTAEILHIVPFFAPYALYIEIPNPDDWSAAPEIESLKIDFVIMRPV